MGPDSILFFPSENVLLLFANGTTRQQADSGNPLSVRSRKINSMQNTTQIQYFYTKKSKGKEGRVERNELSKRKFQLLQLLYNRASKSKPLSVIRCHLALPHVPSNSNGYNQFFPGQITKRTNILQFNNPNDESQQPKIFSFTFNEYQVDLDSSCLALLGLFSQECVSILKELYPIAIGGSFAKSQFFLFSNLLTINSPSGAEKSKWKLVQDTTTHTITVSLANVESKSLPDPKQNTTALSHMETEMETEMEMEMEMETEVDMENMNVQSGSRNKRKFDSCFFVCNDCGISRYANELGSNGDAISNSICKYCWNEEIELV